MGSMAYSNSGAVKIPPGPDAILSLLQFREEWETKQRKPLEPLLKELVQQAVRYQLLAAGENNPAGNLVVAEETYQDIETRFPGTIAASPVLQQNIRLLKKAKEELLDLLEKQAAKKHWWDGWF